MHLLRQVQEYYGLQVGEITNIGKYRGFWLRNKIYMMLPVDSFSEEELNELKVMSDNMSEMGDLSVGTFIPNIYGYFVTTIQNKNYIMVQGNRIIERNDMDFGTELAEFHQRGKVLRYDFQEMNRIGKWKSFWEQRLEQLEKFWTNKVNDNPTNSFERMFVESFPYYLGMTENAIQFLVDTEIDDEPKMFDGATITYERFTPEVWSSRYVMKLPTEWVYDHPSRDLSEYIRHYFLQEESNVGTMQKFLTQYEKISPLSTFAWRLLYARLLFPIHYYEAVEAYYTSKTASDRNEKESHLKSIIENSGEYEEKVKNFFTNIQLPINRLGIRQLDWLQ